MEQKRILMPLQEAGTGHLMPAIAVRDAIEARYPGRCRIDVVDFAKASGALRTDRSIKAVWDRGLAHPHATRAVFQLLQWTHPVPRAWLPIRYPEFIHTARGYLAAYRHDLVFSTHIFCITACAKARDHLKADLKVIGYMIRSRDRPSGQIGAPICSWSPQNEPVTT